MVEAGYSESLSIELIDWPDIDAVICTGNTMILRNHGRNEKIRNKNKKQNKKIFDFVNNSPGFIGTYYEPCSLNSLPAPTASIVFQEYSIFKAF